MVKEVFFRRFHRRFCVCLKSWFKDVVKAVPKSFQRFRSRLGGCVIHVAEVLGGQHELCHARGPFEDLWTNVFHKGS